MHPVYPGRFIDVPAAAFTYFTGFYDGHNDVHRLTTLGLLPANQVHSGKTARLMAERRARQSQALTSRVTLATPF